MNGDGNQGKGGWTRRREVQGILIKSADDIKMGGIANTPECRKTNFKVVMLGWRAGLKVTEWNLIGIKAKFYT